MEIKYKLVNSKILIIALVGVIMTCSSYLMYTYDPMILLMKKLVVLGPSTLMFAIWTDPPVEVLINAYIFNVTNPEAFLNGSEKMKLEEIGPYVYQEILTNENATFNDNGTMTYQPRRVLKYREDLSIGDPEVDWIITPNIPLIGMTASLREASMFTNLGLSTIANILNSKQFLNLTIAEYLWGYDDKLVTLANQALPQWINFRRFGILDRMMSLDAGNNVVTLNMHPENKLATPSLENESKNLAYHIHRWNGSPGLKHWGYIEPKDNETVLTNGKCNMVEGTFEGTVFPPLPEKNTSMSMYRRAFCRPVPFTYVRDEMTSGGFPGYVFQVDSKFLATPDENPDNACYCIKGRCLQKGLSAISPCYYGIPIVLSQPHFYNADPQLLEHVEGMKPNKSLHDSAFVLHSDLGIVIEAALRIQINLEVGQTKYNSRTKPFNGLILPLFWLQMSVDNNSGKVSVYITLLTKALPILQEVLIYLFGILGLALISGSALLALLKSRDEPNSRLSFRGDYSPIPIITTHYFKPSLRISK